MKPFTIAALIFLAISIGGCSGLKRLTGSTNDTVLPGNREEIIPDDQKSAKDPTLSGQGQSQAEAPAVPAVPCDPKKKICPPDSVTVQ